MSGNRRTHSEQSNMKVYSGCIVIVTELRTPLFNLQTRKCINSRFQAEKDYLNKELVFIFFAISSFFSCGSVIQLGSLFFSTFKALVTTGLDIPWADLAF